uniref:FAM20 C-terminal domain-containing protein n=1 Tax=Plectus sambesii TaxID=2011161 RepID=A0A914WR90_9BILA
MGRRGSRGLQAPPPLTFRRCALSMIGCAVLLAVINLYMNLVSSYTMPAMQLDLSPDGDIVGFHQFDLPPGVHQRPRKAKHPRDISLDTPNAVAHTETSCIGLCPHAASTQTQESYVKSLVQSRMRNLPSNTFAIGPSNINIEPLAAASTPTNFSSVWRTASGWSKARQITPANLDSDAMRLLFSAISTAEIIASSVPKRGTQLKLALDLQGGQKALLKPGRYERNWTAPTDTPYSGADRHNGEIAAFHLAQLLQLNRVPVVAGRRVNVERELLATADATLKATFFHQASKSGVGEQACFFGQCLYCRKEDAICASPAGSIESAIILWLPEPYATLKAMRSPWARTYDESRPAPWIVSPNYCEKVMKDEFFGQAPVFLDLMDMAVFDFIIGNADRHRLERFSGVEPPMILLIDNGKSFGNPQTDEISILAPLYQCCRVRTKLYSLLLRYSEIDFASVLNNRLRFDALFPILTDQHLEAVNRRVRIILMVLAACIESHGVSNVVQNDGF